MAGAAIRHHPAPLIGTQRRSNRPAVRRRTKRMRGQRRPRCEGAGASLTPSQAGVARTSSAIRAAAALLLFHPNSCVGAAGLNPSWFRRCCVQVAA